MTSKIGRSLLSETSLVSNRSGSHTMPVILRGPSGAKTTLPSGASIASGKR